MRILFLTTSLFIGTTLMACSNASPPKTRAAAPPPLHGLASGTPWDVIPSAADAIAVSNFTHLPRTTRQACGKLCAPKPPVPATAAQSGVTAWFPHGGPIRAYRFERITLPATSGTYRGLPLYSGSTVAAALLTPSRVLWGLPYRVRLSADLFKGVEPTTALTNRSYGEVIRLLRGGKAAPAVAVLFRDSRVLKGARDWFPSLPLRGGFKITFPPKWATFQAVLIFDRAAAGESFIGSLRSKLAATVGTPNLKQYPWLTLLKPVSVHPEGRNVYIQWAARRELFEQLLKDFSPLVQSISL